MDRKVTGIKPKGRGLEIDVTTSQGRLRKTLALPISKKGFETASMIRQSILLDDQLGRLDFNKHFPNDKRYSRPSHKLSVTQALDSWMRERQRRCSPTTLKNEWSRIDLYIKPLFGNLLVEGLTTADLSIIRDEHPKLTNKTINNIILILTGLTRHLCRSGVITRNPLEHYQPLPTRHKERKPYTLLEIRAVLSEITNVQMQNYFIFAFETGLRPPSELLALKWLSVDWSSKRIYVQEAMRNGKTYPLKTPGSIRHVDLTEKALQTLEKQKQHTDHHEYIFLDPESESHFRNDESIRKRYWIPAVHASKTRYQPPYVTRHCYASHNLSDGKNFKYIADQMGHGDLKMLITHYGKFMPA